MSGNGSTCPSECNNQIPFNGRARGQVSVLTFDTFHHRFQFLTELAALNSAICSTCLCLLLNPVASRPNFSQSNRLGVGKQKHSIRAINPVKHLPLFWREHGFDYGGFGLRRLRKGPTQQPDRMVRQRHGV